MRHPGLAVVAVLLLLRCASARAAGADEWQLGGGAAGALVEVDGEARLAAAPALEVLRGLDDQWSVRAAAAHALADVNDKCACGPNGTAHVSTLAIGARYTLDVVRVLPHAELGLVTSRLGGATVDTRFDFGIELGLGADYLVNPRWALGAAVLGRWLPVRLAGGDEPRSTSPHMLALQLTVARLFD